MTALPGRPSGRPPSWMNSREPDDGYTPLEWELHSRIGHMAGPRVPSVDFTGAVIGAPDLQAGCTIRKVERTGQHKEQM